MYTLRIICIVSCIALFSGGIAHAQLSPFSATADIRVSPSNPGPGQEVRLELYTAYIDVQRADVTWYVNGKEAAQGVGLSKVRIKTGELGSEVRITAQASELNGITVVGERIVRPMIVDLVWEAESYAPLLYRGRTLPSSGTTIKAEALAYFVRSDGSRIPASELIYSWRHNGAAMQHISGAGKSAVRIPLPVFAGSHTLSVEVSTRDNTFVGTAEVHIPVTEPYLALYEDSPVHGVLLHDAVRNRDSFSESEITFAVVPFFASLQRLLDPDALFTWSVNGSPAPTDQTDPARITIAQSSSGPSAARIGVTFDSATELLQDKERVWDIFFSQSGNLQADSSNPFAPRE